MPGYAVLVCMYGYYRENNGEIWCSRPSGFVSPRRDLQE